jgi:AbiV family abortive infection protein
MSGPKGNKNHMGLSNTECVSTAKQTMMNANALYFDAILLANNGSYGRANSLLIHSTEETMKALILMLDGNGFRFRKEVRGINNLFINHKLRYGLAMFFSILSIFTEDLRSFILEIKRDPLHIIDFIKNKEQREAIILQYAQKKIKIVSREVQWFARAEYLRQDGLYVDYVDEVKTPLQFTKQDFEDVLLRIDGMRNFVLFFIEGIESKEEIYVTAIEDLKQKFLDQNWYEKISRLIDLYKDRKKDPLDDLSNKMHQYLTSFTNAISLDDL